MRICILGSGPAGASLFRLLRDRDIEVDIFGQEEKTSCGMKSCSWGVNKLKFEEICRILGLTAENYYTNVLDSFTLNGFKRSCNLAILDKKKLIDSLVGSNVNYRKPNLDSYDRIIDATGSTNGRWHRTYQVRIKESFPLAVRIKPNLEIEWRFPTNGNTHIGILNPRSTKNFEFDKICECYSKIHKEGLVRNLVEGKVWKVGESAGVVDPVTGSGILSSITSSIILSKYLNNPIGYVREMEKTFEYTRSKLRTLFHNEFRGLPIRV